MLKIKLTSAVLLVLALAFSQVGYSAKTQRLQKALRICKRFRTNSGGLKDSI
jgi:hypothetical protein